MRILYIMYICVLELLSSHYELVSVADVNARGEVVGIDLPAVQIKDPVVNCLFRFNAYGI